MVEPLVNLKDYLSRTTPEHSFEPDKLNQRFAEIPPSTEVDQRCRFKAGFTFGMRHLYPLLVLPVLGLEEDGRT